LVGSGVGVGVVVSVGTRVAVAVFVAVNVGVNVGVWVGICVGVGDGVSVADSVFWIAAVSSVNSTPVEHAAIKKVNIRIELATRLIIIFIVDC
jgi:hypothetical protein